MVADKIDINLILEADKKTLPLGNNSHDFENSLQANKTYCLYVPSCCEIYRT